MAGREKENGRNQDGGCSVRDGRKEEKEMEEMGQLLSFSGVAGSVVLVSPRPLFRDETSARLQ